MALNLPIVSTRCCGPEEILQDGKYGLLVDNTEVGLYQGIKKLWDNQYELLLYKEKSVIRINQFALKTSIKKTESLYE